MSAHPPRRRIDVNLNELVMGIGPYTTEVIGCAWLLVCECVESDKAIEDVLARHRIFARLFGLTHQRWRLLQSDIVTLAGKILASSVVTVRYGRGSIPYAVRTDVYHRDGGVCVYCSVPVSFEGFHVDHVTPVSRGGSDDKENLACACPTCNLSKGARTVEEWRGSPS